MLAKLRVELQSHYRSANILSAGGGAHFATRPCRPEAELVTNGHAVDTLQSLTNLPKQLQGSAILILIAMSRFIAIYGLADSWSGAAEQGFGFIFF